MNIMVRLEYSGGEAGDDHVADELNRNVILCRETIRCGGFQSG
jgi:hypothetical protein